MGFILCGILGVVSGALAMLLLLTLFWVYGKANIWWRIVATIVFCVMMYVEGTTFFFLINKIWESYLK